MGLLVVIVCVGVLVYALFSKWLESAMVTLPIVFTVFGWVLGQSFGHAESMSFDHDLIHTLAEITLILVLFSDASRVKLRTLASSYVIPLRMLLIGMPLTIGLGTLLAMRASPDAPWPLALLVAAILTPTDAALGQTVVSSPKVPEKLRQAINVESGLNDGLALPVVMVAATLSAALTGSQTEVMAGGLAWFAIKQVTLGPLGGVLVGFIGAKLLDVAIEAKLATTSLQGVAFLAVAFLCFFVAELIGGNGFIAAFIGGLTFGNVLKDKGVYLYEFLESEGQLLTMFAFLVFGALLLPQGLAHANAKTIVLSIGYLTVVRMLPIVLSLWGTSLPFKEKLFLGWFGPRGLASILFAILVFAEFSIPGGEEILACVVLTVLISIFAHGISAKPLSDRIGSSG